MSPLITWPAANSIRSFRSERASLGAGGVEVSVADVPPADSLNVRSLFENSLTESMQQGSRMRSSPVTVNAGRLLKDGIIGEVKEVRLDSRAAVGLEAVPRRCPAERSR